MANTTRRHYMNIFDIEFRLICRRFLRAALFFIRYTTFRKFFNFILIELERKLKKKLIKGAPYFIKLQSTNKCDSGCKYCLRQSSEYPLGTMDLKDFKEIIDKSKNYVYLIALHFDGEPLLNDRIYDMIYYAHSNRIATYVSTNLQHLKKEDTQKMLLSGLDLLTVSLDGATEQTYRHYRNKGSLHSVLNNISILVKEKKKSKRRHPEISIQFIVMEHNEHEIEKIKKIAADLEVDSLELKVLGSWDKSMLPRNQAYLRRIYKRENLKRQSCWWLWSALLVLWDGNVRPCCMFDERASAGNLIEGNLVQIKNSLLLQSLRRPTPLNDSAYRKNCVQCKIPYGSLIYQTI